MLWTTPESISHSGFPLKNSKLIGKLILARARSKTTAKIGPKSARVRARAKTKIGPKIRLVL